VSPPPGGCSILRPRQAGVAGLTSGIEERVYRNEGNPPLLDLLPAAPGRALDLGCGAGDNARLLAERGWKVTGVTLSPGERESASRWCERVHLADLDQALPEIPRGAYDLVLLSHVLEHLPRPETALDLAREALVPGGLVAVALPNVLFYPIRVAALFGRFEYADAGILDRTHLRFYTWRGGAALLEDSGFEVLAASASGGFPLGRLRRWLPRSWVERIEAFAVRARPGLFGRQSLYLARPRRAAAGA